MTRNDGRFALSLYNPPFGGSGGFIEDLTEKRRQWRRSIRRVGGFWEGSFFLPLGGAITASYLRNWFNRYLMCRVEEKIGGTVTWQGLVWSMELNLNGIKRKRSISDVFNAVKVHYKDADGNEQKTSWYTNDTSIDRYLRREIIITLDEATSAQAIKEAQTALLSSTEPWPQTTAIDTAPNSQGLTVQCVGDVFTAQNRYVSVITPFGTDTLSDHMTDLITTDCDLLTATKIATNSTAVSIHYDKPIRVWDRLVELTEMGDGTQPYIFRVDPDGRAVYEAASNLPDYEWWGYERGLVFLTGAKNPWMIRPTVLRDRTISSTTPIPGTFLADGRDEWIGEVQMSDGADNATLKPESFSEDEISNLYEQNKTWIAELKVEQQELLEKEAK